MIVPKKGQKVRKHGSLCLDKPVLGQRGGGGNTRHLPAGTSFDFVTQTLSATGMREFNAVPSRRCSQCIDCVALPALLCRTGGAPLIRPAVPFGIGYSEKVTALMALCCLASWFAVVTLYLMQAKANQVQAHIRQELFNQLLRCPAQANTADRSLGHTVPAVGSFVGHLQNAAQNSDPFKFTRCKFLDSSSPTRQRGTPIYGKQCNISGAGSVCHSKATPMATAQHKYIKARTGAAPIR